MSKMIGFASDHAGFGLKERSKNYLISKGWTCKDYGTYNTESCDYADFAHPLAISVESGECEFGIAICGSGNGINMTLNKHRKIRAALCWNMELAQLARAHNDANILVLPARFIENEDVRRIIDEFLKTKFERGRHKKRIEKMLMF